MKLKIQKCTAGVLIVLIIIVLILSPISVKDAEAEEIIAPFATMYDSDKQFLENFNDIFSQDGNMSLQIVDNQQLSELDEQYEQSDKNSLEEENEQVFDNSRTKMLELTNTTEPWLDSDLILNVLNSEESDKLMDLPLSEVSRSIIENLYKQTRVNQFIIKYKSDGNLNCFKDASLKSIESVEQITTVDSNLQKIVLSERVNPKEFAKTISALGLESQIEYIQPDFVLKFASVDWSNDINNKNENEKFTKRLLDNNCITTSVETDTIDKNANNSKEEEKKIVDEEIDVQMDKKEKEFNQTDSMNEIDSEYEQTKKSFIKKEIIVALIDTGVDINHPDLDGRIVDGWNFVENVNTVYNPDNHVQYVHGTHIAGVIANNSSKYVKIMPLKVFDGREACTSDIIAAIAYAEEHGASVVNCSFGSGDMNPALQESMSNSNMLFVASSGNSRSDLNQLPFYPATFNLDNIISVSSINEDGGFLYYSNYSNEIVDIAALGQNVLSTMPENSQGLLNGTSVSAGFVSAAVGELYAQLIGEEINTISSVSTKSAISTTSAIYQDYDFDMTRKSNINTYIRKRLLDGADKLVNLENKVAGGRRLNLNNAIKGVEGEYLNLEFDNDFDVKGYRPTQDELIKEFNSSGKPVKIAAGHSHALVLLENGTVWTWGRGYNGLTQVIGLDNTVDISAGFNHSLALKADGTVWEWNETLKSNVPVQIEGYEAKYISAGEIYSQIIYEEIGNDNWSYVEKFDKYSNEEQSLISMVKNPLDCSVGSHCIILEDNSNGDVQQNVLVEGNLNYGALGGKPIKSNNKIGLSELNGFMSLKQVESGNYQNFALEEDGTVWNWGFDLEGKDRNNTPIKIDTLSNIKAISSGGNYILDNSTNNARISTFLKNDGTVFEWSEIYSGQVKNFDNVKQVEAGSMFTIALENDGTIWGWGINNGVLGDKSLKRVYDPTQLFAEQLTPELSQINIEAVSEKEYDVIVPAKSIKSFKDIEFILNYDEDVFELTDLCIFTKDAELKVALIDTINYIEVGPGKLKFTVDKQIPEGKEWSGVLTGIRLKAKKSENSVIKISLNNMNIDEGDKNEKNKE